LKVPTPVAASSLLFKMADDIPKAPGRSDEGELEEEKREEAQDSHRRPSLRRGFSERPDHFKKLVRQKRASMIMIEKIFEGEGSTVSRAEKRVPDSLKDVLTESKMKKLQAESAALKEAEKLLSEVKKYFPQDDNRVEVRLKNFSYRVNVDPNEIRIQTVYNQSCIYDARRFFRRTFGKENKPEKQTAYVLEDIDLNFLPGKMYLVLGPPASGKTTLLRAIAGRLSTTNGEVLEGSVLYNGLSLKVHARKETNYPLLVLH
jgi:ABC-type multidrug transport system fused ATPase/permease subunit